MCWWDVKPYSINQSIIYDACMYECMLVGSVGFYY